MFRQKKRTGSKVSRDQGYYEGDDDAMSVATLPAHLPSRGGRRVSVHKKLSIVLILSLFSQAMNVGGTEVLLRTHTSRKSRPNSDHIPDETPRRHNNYAQLTSIREDRRHSLPHDSILDDFQKTYLSHRGEHDLLLTLGFKKCVCCQWARRACK